MKLYNTPKKTVEEIKASAEGVGVYTCGPTVYDYLHIGNWFTFIRYDLLIRALKAGGLQPKWVMNITDVGHLVSDADDGEDKLEKGAKREGKTAWEVAQFYTDYFTKSLERLNISKPDELPKATDHIAEQIDLVKQLEEKGFTYVIDDGVYFDTAKFPSYADFAGLHLDALEAGARVEVNKQKHNPSDFALWKFSPEGQQRDMEWDSPWGKGFPGWHLECSAMAMKYLGETVDIHAGGIDHIPVHHTNEIAQSEAATGKPFVRYWLHTNHITVDGQKIAKSLGNGITLEAIEAKGFSALDVRMLALESHYRSQSQFTWTTLQAAHNRLQSLQNMAVMRFQAADEGTNSRYDDITDGLLNALADDLDTPTALRLLAEAVDRTETYPLTKAALPSFEKLIETTDELLGLGLGATQDITTEQQDLLKQRDQAREDKDWSKADELRGRLAAQGVGVNDTSTGQVWYRI